MDISQIRKLLREGRSVVLVEEGKPPLLVTELKVDASPEVREMVRPAGDQVLERLNKEILALKAQIAQDEQI